MDSSRNDDSEADITNTEQNSKSEDDDLSDDDEIRQMEEQLERKRHEKKQNKLKEKEEKHKQLIKTEKSDLKFLSKETDITNKKQNSKGEDDDLSDETDITNKEQNSKGEGDDLSDSKDIKTDITNKEQTSKGEDDDLSDETEIIDKEHVSKDETVEFSDDEEMRELNEQLNNLTRAEKKQRELAMKKENLRQLIQTQHSVVISLTKETEITNKEINTKRENDNLSNEDEIRQTEERKRIRAAERQKKSAQKEEKHFIKVEHSDVKSMYQEKTVTGTEKNVSSEDENLSDDEEMRQLKQQLEIINNEKKQHKLVQKKEKLKQLIEEEKSSMKSINKGMPTGMRSCADVVHDKVHASGKCKSEGDKCATFIENRHVNKNQDIIQKEESKDEMSSISIESSNADNQVSTANIVTMANDQRQAQDIVQNKLYVPTDDADFELFMNKVGLGRFYPETLQLSDIIKIKCDGLPQSVEDIAFMFIRNLIMINFTCRDTMLEEYLNGIPSPDYETSESGDYLDQILGDQNDKKNNLVNPLDLTLSVFKCSSPMLKQILAAKLFLCQLAIPFVFPAIGNGAILVSMWPLRSIVIDRKTEKGSFQDIAVDCPCQIVSFIRFGRPTISKSKLTNEILRDQYHNTFFNKDCPLGTTKRVLSEGLIEVAWYLPSSKYSVLSKVCMFLNLRGDGEILEEQVKLLSNISSVVVLIAETKSLDNTNYQQLMLSLNQTNAGVILAIDGRTNSKESLKQKLKTISNGNTGFNNQHKCIVLSVEGQDRSIAMIRKEMRNGLEELIKDKQDQPLLERLYTRSADIDEYNECFRNTRTKAEGIIKLIPVQTTCKSVKEEITPLQGELWRKWSEKNKLVNKASQYKSLEEHGQIMNAMKQIRDEQVKICEHLDSFMGLFLKSMITVLPSKTDCAVFVLWLKHFFDERSRSILPTYLSKYHSDWQALKKARDKKAVKVMTALRDQLDKSEHNLAEASFGFEHVCREMGQIYEAICTCHVAGREMEDLKQQLPMITAKLLLLGLPFEIMDGDAANVPMLWVKAVLNNLKDLIGDKKLLALSVLGIQSSGKSTLLNTMFGLQFAVSAGRCTRGVFMQLVPVDGKLFPFDWVLVIDTEGLRAPELGQQKYSHDNELATFVIGLGDITVVNIKGENTAEVKDVLQIAVHAFLRLKLANKRLNIKQSCVFVHQNVPAIDATDKMLHGRQKFVEILDAMTKEAADEEDIADIQSFNQVIEFDSEKHVWYFSDLWRGDPPMCPANPGYSENVKDVRNAIMFDLTKKRETWLTLTDTITRIEDLWNGILKDDFVFSFRNSLELKAYNNMERQCRTLTWDLEKLVLEFIRSDAERILVNCENPNDLERVIPSIIKRLSMNIDKKVTSMIAELDSFIDANTLKEVMIQWKQNKQNRFKMLAEDLIMESKIEISKTKDEIWFKKVRESEQTKHEIEINEMARQLALKMQGESPTEAVMKQMFDDKWNTLINQCITSDAKDAIPIREQIEKLLYTKFHSETLYFEETFGEYYYEKMAKLEDTIHIEQINEKHISIHKRVYFFDKDNLTNCKLQTLDITNKIFRKIDTKLLELNAQDKRFNTSYVTEIMQFVIKGIEEHNSVKAKEYKFNLTQPFRGMMLAHVVHYATVFFTRLNDAYNSKHSLKAQIQAYKGTAWALFNNLVQSNTEDVIALGFFREAIVKTVEEHVLGLLPIDAQDKILNLFSNGKCNLIKDILVHLAETGDFKKIKAFIGDPRAFAESWIIRLTNDQLFDEKLDGMNSFTRLAKSRITKIFSQLLISINQATQSTKTSIAIWIENFVKHSNDSKGLPLSNSTFVHVKDRDVPDLKNFVEMLKSNIGEMETYVIGTFKVKSESTFKWKNNPVISIMDKLWGCAEVCMFCGEPCMNTDKNHVSDGYPHKCLQHRPKGIYGMRYTESENLVEAFCNHSVNTNATYKNVQDKSGKFSDFKTNFPDWEIAPNSDVSKYWIWIFYNFQKQLKITHNAKLPKCPVNWASISKSEAIQSLGTCRALTWELNKFVLDFKRSDAESILLNCENPDELERTILSIIQRLNEEYNRKHSLKAQIQAYKGTAWELFKNLVQSKTEDVIALGFFWQAITMTVTEHVSGFLPMEAENEIVDLFPDGKSSVIKDILIHLAQDEDFSNIKSFIEDSRAFAEGWIIRLTNRILFEEQSHGTNVFTRLEKSRITKIFTKLFDSIKHTTKSTKTSIALWIVQFVKHSNDSNGLPLSITTFVHVKDQNVSDREFRRNVERRD
ncbi:unnamed protein product [Mytilus coruscus]|uniref:VLIG-type G domain-containing protein n=1 Tax=Mytilus coruscus TaxID=42192 RepID=A0A6J8F3B5_MYTCO|nr:unnamed protein product [Mytilus coruscus]